MVSQIIVAHKLALPGLPNHVAKICHVANQYLAPADTGEPVLTGVTHDVTAGNASGGFHGAPEQSIAFQKRAEQRHLLPL